MTRYPAVTVSEAAHYEFLHAVGTCAVTGRSSERIEVAHMRDNVHALNKTNPGMGRKPHYAWCLPMAASEHEAQHKMGAPAYFLTRWWPVEDLERGPLAACLVLMGFSALGDDEGARRWIAHCTLERTARRLKHVR